MKVTKYLFLFFLLLFFPLHVFADSASSTVVMEMDSGRILYMKNPDQKRLIASITKIMTCLIVLENSDLDEEVTVGEEVLEMYGTNIYIEVGEKLKVKDLLYGLMLRSGNDAAIALANHVFESEEKFVEEMNAKAKELGMKHTSFQNPHGLDEETKNYSTARDMAILNRYAYQNKTYREIVGTKKYTCKSSLKSYAWYNRMSLLTNYKYCIGGKNGYTPSAGKTLVTLAQKKGMTLGIVSLNDGNLYENHESLYEEYFKKYQLYKIIDKDTFSLDTNFVGSNVYVKKSFQYPLLEEELDDVSTVVEVMNKTNSSTTGRIVVKLEDEEIGNIPIYQRKEKKETISFFQKIKDLFVR